VTPIGAPLARIVAWCEATGTELVGIVEDAGVSEAKPLADRSGGARIAFLLAARKSEVDTVVIARLDRLGRGAAETLSYLKAFAKGSLGLVSGAERIDGPSRANGPRLRCAQQTVQLSQAGLQSRNASLVVLTSLPNVLCSIVDFRRADPERSGDLEYVREAGIAFAALDAADVRRVEFASLREGRLTEPAFVSDGAHCAAESGVGSGARHDRTICP